MKLITIYLYSNVVIYLHGAPAPDGKLLKKDPPVPFVLFSFVVLTLSTKHSAHKQRAGSGQIESATQRVSVVQEATAAVLEPREAMLCFASWGEPVSHCGLNCGLSKYTDVLIFSTCEWDPI